MTCTQQCGNCTTASIGEVELPVDIDKFDRYFRQNVSITAQQLWVSTFNHMLTENNHSLEDSGARASRAVEMFNKQFMPS